MDKAKKRMRKLLALAERGVGGEQETAQRMLDTMLHKHGITLSDLTNKETTLHFWSCYTKHDRTLLLYICGMVLDSTTIKYTKQGRQVGVKLTAADRITVDLHYQMLRKGLREHVDRAVTAFIMANELYPKTVSTDDDVPRERTREEEMKWDEIRGMSRIIDPIKVYPQISYE